MAVPFLFSNGVLTVVVKGMSKSIDSTHPNYTLVRDALKSGTEDEVLALLSKQPEPEPEPEPEQPSKPRDVKQNEVSVVDGVLYYGVERIDNDGLTRRVADLQSQGLPFDGMVKFIQRLWNNVSFRVRKELLAFIDHNGLTIDSEGYLIAYKAVREDYLDKYSGTVDNHPGRTISMDRGKVDDDYQTGCSHGLHAGALEYVYSYGNGNDRIVIVRIDPADVVSVPSDCEHRKLRTCAYTVLGDYNGELQKVVYAANNSVQDWYAEDEDAYDSDDDDFDWDSLEEEDDESEFEDDDDKDDEYERQWGLTEDDDEEDPTDKDGDGYGDGYQDDGDRFDSGDVQSVVSSRVVDNTPHQVPDTAVYGTKPDGKKYYKVRGDKGRWVRR